MWLRLRYDKTKIEHEVSENDHSCVSGYSMRTYPRGKSISLFPFYVYPPGYSFYIVSFMISILSCRFTMSTDDRWQYVHIIIMVRFLSICAFQSPVQIAVSRVFLDRSLDSKIIGILLSICQQEEPLDCSILPSTSLLLRNNRAIEPMTNTKNLTSQRYILFVLFYYRI